MNPSLDNNTTIRIKKRTLLRLKEIGGKGDTYEEVINILCDTYELSRQRSESEL